METGLGGGLSGLWVVGTMVTLGVNVGGVSFFTLGEGAGQSIWSTPAGEGRGSFRVGAVGGITVTLEKMRESVWMEEIDHRPELQTELELGVRERRRVRRRLRWRRLLSFQMGRGNRGGKTPLFWRCALRRYVECKRGDISSGQGRVQGTIH